MTGKEIYQKFNLELGLEHFNSKGTESEGLNIRGNNVRFEKTGDKKDIDTLIISDIKTKKDGNYEIRISRNPTDTTVRFSLHPQNGLPRVLSEISRKEVDSILAAHLPMSSNGITWTGESEGGSNTSAITQEELKTPESDEVKQKVKEKLKYIQNNAGGPNYKLSSDQIFALQYAMAYDNFDNNKIKELDGKWGPQTLDAINGTINYLNVKSNQSNQITPFSNANPLITYIQVFLYLEYKMTDEFTAEQARDKAMSLSP